MPKLHAKDCYNQSGGCTSYYEPKIHLAKLPISYTRNKFMAIGCDTYAMIQGSKKKNYAMCIEILESLYVTFLVLLQPRILAST